MDLKQATQQALQIQDASNLSGVLHFWLRILPLIWEDVRATGVPFNQHYLNILLGSKVNSLTGYEQLFSAAYTKAQEVAMGA